MTTSPGLRASMACLISVEADELSILGNIDNFFVSTFECFVAGVHLPFKDIGHRDQSSWSTGILKSLVCSGPFLVHHSPLRQLGRQILSGIGTGNNEAAESGSGSNLSRCFHQVTSGYLGIIRLNHVITPLLWCGKKAQRSKSVYQVTAIDCVV